MVLLFPPRGLGCGSCLWPWSAVPAGEESWEPGQQRVSSCSSAAGKCFWCLSTQNLTVLWGEVSQFTPLDAYPSLPSCPPKSVWFGSHLRGNVWGLEQPWEESRGKNVGQLSLAELQLCHPEMETALVTSGNDIPSTHPALASPGQGTCSGAGTELSWWCSPFCVTSGEVEKL